ncbi:MAG: alanine/glycine:cation symporter family protein [Longimicrobiales bacterium]
MESLTAIVSFLEEWVLNKGITIGGEAISISILALIGTGVFLTLRLGFIQVRRLGHGFGVTSGKYDDPNEPGDVSHFQALSTALSATVGIGNIAGVAIAIHWGGPGALFWMWLIAFLGMATKYAEVVLAQHYRVIERADRDPAKWEGTVSGGPMYYIEKGLGPNWKWMATFFALMLGTTAFLTGNGIQANTLADTLEASFGVPPVATGIVSSVIVGAVILGGITRIGRVAGILAPLMAAIYVAGGLIVIFLNIGEVLPSLALIVREAFNPSAGVAGAGIGAIVTTMTWGVRRGLFSNEAGQGSAPIAHAAAKTDEPVSEGVVALLEPFIDTIVICTMTGLVVVMTGVWNERHPTALDLAGGDSSWIIHESDGRIRQGIAPAQEIRVDNGVPASIDGQPRFAWHEASVDEFFLDAEQTRPFTGVIRGVEGRAIADDGQVLTTLYGNAAESGAPLTSLAFQRGFHFTQTGAGEYFVILGVILFAISTAISWSYYGDRCANYLFGKKAVIPYRVIYVIMHFVGAVATLNLIWRIGDVFLGIVILPNLLALLILSPKVVALTKSYFERRPWIENADVHRRLEERKRTR